MALRAVLRGTLSTAHATQPQQPSPPSATPTTPVVVTTTAAAAAAADAVVPLVTSCNEMDDYFVHLCRLDAPPRSNTTSPAAVVNSNRNKNSNNSSGSDGSGSRRGGALVMGARGIAQLCADLDVSAVTSLEALVLLWRLGATRANCVEAGEWQRAMHMHRVTTRLQLKQQLRVWTTEVRTHEVLFAHMYDFLYDYIRGERDRLMSCSRAVRAWRVLFASQPLCAPWCAWAAAALAHSAITRDLWRQVRVLLLTCTLARRDCDRDNNSDNNNDNNNNNSGCDDVVCNYNAVDGQWPTVMDDFVASLRTAAVPPS